MYIFQVCAHVRKYAYALRGKQVELLHGPATVSEESVRKTSLDLSEPDPRRPVQATKRKSGDLPERLCGCEETSTAGHFRCGKNGDCFCSSLFMSEKDTRYPSDRPGVLYKTWSVRKTGRSPLSMVAQYIIFFHSKRRK